MKIGIIGAGNIGQALARLGIAHGHAVTLSNSRDPDTLASLAEDIGCTPVAIDEAARSSDIIILTIPFAAVFTLDTSLLDGRIVVDTNNYYPERDGNIAALDDRATTTSEMVAAHFGGASIVKAFNAILAADLREPISPVSGHRRALPVAGNDAAAKAVVASLQSEFGFDVVDTGELADSWRFERAKPAYCIPLDQERLVVALDKAERDVELPHGSWRR
ncbi:coenzyme F420-dependent NADP oxidoreductase [Sphingopyxis fribergensis]|uniref:Coenzyme F420-dependent NADP oxidoreductase n=1 Tax=Sphingopyxis fribergensis TaxID=1515612 RepID=A0A0A7PR45_9SPHN|nr:NAD(P)-binding domain-containing protein [Sphingopyxis fribergensis]AJA10447.1 coenzyme F420-dependent NADP oxidoreductase [Sphingopyxis fribergensis]